MQASAQRIEGRASCVGPSGPEQAASTRARLKKRRSEGGLDAM